MQIHGKIEVINDTQKISDKFSKREFVLTTEASTQYPQSISMEFTQDKCDLLNLYQVGQDVSVDFNLRGRKWEGPQGVKYFNTIQAWKIEAVNGTTKPGPVSKVPEVTAEEVNSIVNNSVGDNEDLPF